MFQPADSPRRALRIGRILRALGAVLALLLPAILSTGCGDELAREFRSAAADQVHTGISSIIDGVLDGLFTIADPSTDPNSAG